MMNIECSTGVLQELMYLLPRFISDSGLAEFVLDGLSKDAVIDMGAMAHILEEPHELRKLGIRNINEINAESHGELITTIRDLIQSEPTKLEELDFCAIGGSTEQGGQVLDAIHDSEMQVKKLDISENPEWTQSESYS